VADKEEVEPTEESSAAELSDAADSADPQAGDLGSEPDRSTDEPAGTEPDEFDEIVRGGDFNGAHVLGSADDIEGVAVEDDTDDDDDDDDEEKALEPAGVGAASAGAGSVAERRAARKPKEVATRRRDEPVKAQRTGPVKFVKESVGELRKVVYPTGQQLINYFVVVLVFVLFIIGYVSLLDLGLGAAIFRIFS